MAGRSRERCEAAIDDLKERTGGKVAQFLPVDLADLVSVRAGAREFLGCVTDIFHGFVLLNLDT